MERLLDTVDAVIYILDYTKLKTQEEADLLSKLKVRPCLFWDKAACISLPKCLEPKARPRHAGCRAWYPH